VERVVVEHLKHFGISAGVFFGLDQEANNYLRDPSGQKPPSEGQDFIRRAMMRECRGM